MKNKNVKRVLALLFIGPLLTLSMAGCWESGSKSKTEEMTETIEDTAEKAEEVVEDATDKAEEAIEEASEEMEDATETPE